MKANLLPVRFRLITPITIFMIAGILLLTQATPSQAKCAKLKTSRPGEVALSEETDLKQ